MEAVTQQYCSVWLDHEAQAYTGMAHHYKIGEIPNPGDINLTMSGNEKMSFASTLRKGEGAFVRRSNGTWRFAVVAGRKYGSDSSLLFDVEFSGNKSTGLKKEVKKSHWCDFICAVRNHPPPGSRYSQNTRRINHFHVPIGLSRISSSAATFTGDYAEDKSKAKSQSSNCGSNGNATDFSQFIASANTSRNRVATASAGKLKASITDVPFTRLPRTSEGDLIPDMADTLMGEDCDNSLAAQGNSKVKENEHDLQRGRTCYTGNRCDSKPLKNGSVT